MTADAPTLDPDALLAEVQEWTRPIRRQTPRGHFKAILPAAEWLHRQKGWTAGAIAQRFVSEGKWPIAQGRPPTQEQAALADRLYRHFKRQDESH